MCLHCSHAVCANHCLCACVRVLCACDVWLAGERGPSAGKEWFWLRNNSKLDVSHLVPDFSHFPSATTSASNSNTSSPQSFGSWYAAAGGGASSSRPWHVPGGMWWEEGWRLGAVCLHSWPAHRERLRALAVDPWERLLVTAGRWAAAFDIELCCCWQH